MTFRAGQKKGRGESGEEGTRMVSSRYQSKHGADVMTRWINRGHLKQTTGLLGGEGRQRREREVAEPSRASLADEATNQTHLDEEERGAE
jgi:hypothetical protein